MNVPILSKRRAAFRAAVEAEAMGKALVAVDQALVETGTVEKGFLTGNAAAMMSSKGVGSARGKQPGTSWSNQSSTSNRLIARVTQNLSQGFARAPEELELALAEQGLSWGPPFAPGRPLDPFQGYRTPARTFDYPVGSNTQLTPRWNRVSFPTIKSIYEAYDVAQICVRHLINDVRSLEYNWEPIPGVKADVANEIEQAIEFFYSPDKRQPFRTWLAEWLQDVLRYDAGALYIRRNNADEPIALEVVDGTTIIPLVDFYGRRPEDEDDESATSAELFHGNIVPAYVQIIEGLPWDWLTSDDLLYQPWNPVPESQYGLAPLEAVLLSANTDIRFQWHFLQFFTEGTLPAGFMEAPPDMSDPAQIASWQEAWDAVMQGDQTKARQIRWVPNGSKFTAGKPEADKFSPDFVLYLARRTMASFGVTPNDLGFTEDVNRATGDTQVDVQFRVGTSPLLRYAEDVINLFVKEHLKLRVRIRFDDGKETEDRVATATADGIYLDHGVKGIDEVRAEQGLPIDKSKPSPRYINNSRSGPIPIIALESMGGDVDPDTYGVADTQELIDTPYIPPPGLIPAAGTEELKGAEEASARMANTLRTGTPDTGTTAENNEDTDPKAEEEEEEAEVEPSPIEKAIAQIDEILKGVDNTGGPGVHPATTITGGTDGITVETGVQGEDLLDDEDDDEEDAVKVALSLRRWRDNSRNRLKKGRAPRRFIDPSLPAEVHDEVWSKLRRAGTRQEVDAAFAAIGKKSAAGDGPAPRSENGTPGFHKHTQTIVDYYTPLIAKAIGASLSLKDIEAATKRALAKKDTAVKEAQPAEDDVLRSQLDNTALQEVLAHLRGDAAIQGTIEAAVAAGSGVAGDLQCVVNQLPADYWDNWQPGFGKAADAELTRGADDRIQGMTNTSLERLTNTIADGLSKGDSVQAVAKEALDDLGSMARAEMVVNTEYAQSMTEANLETYKEANVEKLEWMAEGDACPECEENEAASPLAAGDDWPNGDVPVHPNCRCAIAPIIDLDEVEKTLYSVGLAKDLQGEIDALYSDKACDIITPELPPGDIGSAIDAVQRIKTDSVFSAGEADIGKLHDRGITDETGHIETVSTKDLIPMQSHLKPSVIAHAKANPEAHPIKGIKDPFSGKVYVINGHHGAAAAIGDGKATVDVNITRQLNSPHSDKPMHGLNVPGPKPRNVLKGTGDEN